MKILNKVIPEIFRLSFMYKLHLPITVVSADIGKLVRIILLRTKNASMRKILNDAFSPPSAGNINTRVLSRDSTTNGNIKLMP